MTTATRPAIPLKGKDLIVSLPKPSAKYLLNRMKNKSHSVQVTHLGETLYLVMGPLRGAYPAHASVLSPEPPPSTMDKPSSGWEGLRGQHALKQGGKCVESLPSSLWGWRGGGSRIKALGPGVGQGRRHRETQEVFVESELGSGPSHLAQPGTKPVWSDLTQRGGEGTEVCEPVCPWEQSSKATESSFSHCFRGDGPLEFPISVNLA